MNDVADEYKAARGVLLDALDAIEGHITSVILVGAQAVYAHTGRGSLSLAPYTTDSDLALRASVLEESPDLAVLLKAADFAEGRNPGSWLGRGDVVVDLMVVPHESNTTKPGARAAKLPGHSSSVARVTPGLEPALIDHAPQVIAALDGRDKRSFVLEVAGPAALVAAKIVKIRERHESTQRGGSDRLRAKDALDIFRLLREVEIDTFASGFASHTREAHAKAVSDMAVAFLREHGTGSSALLPRLAAAELVDDVTVAPSFAALAQDLLASLNRR